MNRFKTGVLFLSIIAYLFSGCSKYGFVKINYPLPPAAYLPETIKKIALVNRSLTKNEDKTKKIIETILTGEIAGSDRLASDECLKAVYDNINGQNGITIIIPEKTRLHGTGTRETPELMDWKRVKEICDSNTADALLVLETFDSNSDVFLSAIANQTNTIAIGGMQPSVPRRIRVNVLSFWRLYDPISKTIIDQFENTNYMFFNGIGLSYSLPPRNALPQTAYDAGRLYIQRFLPGTYSARRDLYKRGKMGSKKMFKAAFRRTETANWQGAIDIWNDVEKDGRRKNSGRACLNIAVAYEVLGNTNLAIQWAQRSYELYNNKLGRSYSKVLLKQ